MSVTVVSCVYGDRFPHFIPRWQLFVNALTPAADAVIVASDRVHDIKGAEVVVSDCPWKHPQAWYLNQAIEAAETDWVWIVDIDDCAMSDGLRGLEDVEADVWQVGYRRSDGEVYIPKIASHCYVEGNLCVAGSMIRKDAFPGFSDVAFQDWNLWTQLVIAGADFAYSDRAHYHYMRHPHTRSETELTPETRDAHIQEMNLALA